jgi:16S rRNA (cytidine1402-2'-O)-methyltransferase
MGQQPMTDSDSNVHRGPGTLWLVATPIGNLADLPARAADVLRNADLLLAEDTRHTQQLLNACGIARAPGTVWSFHEHNERERIDSVLERLRAGQNVALVSDAGTPLVSDPGAPLVVAVAAAGLPMSAVPGPCAAIVALSMSALPVDRFCFEGFLPAKAGARRASLDALRTEARTIVCYEAPHRIADALQDCATILGEARRAIVARELTKKFETIYRGTLVELAARARDEPDLSRGEIVIVIEGLRAASVDAGDGEVDRVLRVLLAELPVSQASRIAAQLTGRGRNLLDDRAVELRGSGTQPAAAAGKPPND